MHNTLGHRLIPPPRVAIPIQVIFLRSPKVRLTFVGLSALLQLLLLGGQTFGLLVSLPCSSRCFAAYQTGKAEHRAEDLGTSHDSL